MRNSRSLLEMQQSYLAKEVFTTQVSNVVGAGMGEVDNFVAK